MQNIEWMILVLILLAWACARWSNLVSKKVPDWIHTDWNHQATTFLAQKDTVMIPDATDESVAVGEPEPAYRWWTPARAPHFKTNDHKLWWIPFVGPVLNKDYRGLWTEVWVVLLSIVLLGSVSAVMELNAIPDLGMGRVLGGILFFAWLQSMSNVDHKTQFLPDIMTLPLIWLGLLWAVLQPGLISAGHAIEGAVLGFMLLWGLNKAFWVLRRKQGLGGGDLKLAAAVGAWVGPTGVLMTIGLSSFIALGMALFLLLARKNFRQFAYGPSIALAGVIVYLTQPFLWLAAHNIAK